MKDVSVIVPVYNEQDAIRQCLESLANQSLKPREVIVIDDGSTDNTFKVLSELKVARPAFAPLSGASLGEAGKKGKLKVLKQEHKGAGAARNLGAKKATGKILVFIDADMRFSRKFLEDLTGPIHKKESKGLTLPARPLAWSLSRGTFSKQEFIANWHNRWARYWNYWRGIYEPRAVLADYPKTAPVFRAILKSEFEKAGGFDETRGYNDDWSLSERLGYRAKEAKARFYHRNPASLNEAFTQARWAAKRRYKHGIIGALVALTRACPLWSPLIGLFQVFYQKNQLAESMMPFLFLYSAFLFTVNSAATMGIFEYLISKKVSK